LNQIRIPPAGPRRQLLIEEQRVVRCGESRGGYGSAGSALGGLQGIDFPVSFTVGGLQMGRHVTGPHAPLHSRIGKYKAVFTGGKLSGFLTAVALFDYRVAHTPIKLTPFLAHEMTIVPFLYRSTNHDNHILSMRNLQI
jgi:hypothetical protein